jgi:hypothetical protein
MCILCINQNNDWCSLVAPGIQFLKLTSMIPCGFLRMWTEMVMLNKLFLLMQTENWNCGGSSIFSDIAPYSLQKVCSCFRATYCLHLHNQKTCQARNLHEAGSKQGSVAPKWWLTFNRLHMHYTPEDRTLQNNRCENLKLYIYIYIYIYMCVCVCVCQ